MLFGKKDNSQIFSKGKQSPAMIVVVVLLILGAGFFLVRNFMGGPSEGVQPEYPIATDQSAAPANPTPTVPPVPASTAPAKPAQSAAPTAPAPKPVKPVAAKPAEPKKIKMQTMSVFGKVTVSYPEGWGIDITKAKNVAVFTDKNAVFEVQSPDPKATTAKAIADTALKTLGKGGKIIAQASDKVSGRDAYWYAVNVGGRTTRIVGIDGLTRIVVVAYVKNGSFDSYRDTFNQMQSAITFAQ